MDNMKEKIENELFYMLHDKSLDKITVTELVKRCNVSRQTFYYYFKDVYAVLDSIFKREADSFMAAKNLKSWKDGYVGLLNWTLEHRDYIINVLKSVPRENVEHCVSKKLHVYACTEVSRSAEGMKINEKQKEYIAEFYALSLTAYYLHWIESGMVEKPEFEGRTLSILLDGNLMNALRKFALLNENAD